MEKRTNSNLIMDPYHKTDKEIIEMLDFMDEYYVSSRFRQLKRENAALKRKLTILNRKHNANDRIPKKRIRGII